MLSSEGNGIYETEVAEGQQDYTGELGEYELYFNDSFVMTSTPVSDNLHEKPPTNNDNDSLKCSHITNLTGIYCNSIGTRSPSDIYNVFNPKPQTNKVGNVCQDTSPKAANMHSNSLKISPKHPKTPKTTPPAISVSSQTTRTPLRHTKRSNTTVISPPPNHQSKKRKTPICSIRSGFVTQK